MNSDRIPDSFSPGNKCIKLLPEILGSSLDLICSSQLLIDFPGGVAWITTIFGKCKLFFLYRYSI